VLLASRGTTTLSLLALLPLVRSGVVWLRSMQ
jgi:hypothetical protein